MLNILIINNEKIINCEAEPNNARQLKQKKRRCTLVHRAFFDWKLTKQYEGYAQQEG